jgi:hypothetical protein
MLTKHDELLCHQIPSTFDHVSDSGANWRENVWCCAHDISGKMFLTSVFGVSTNRNVIDGSGLLAFEGKTQYNIRASRELRSRIEDVRVGPLSYEVIEGLKSVRWVLAENDQGICWEVEFEGRMPPHEEVPQFKRARGRVTENICRFGQTGRAKGWVKVEGKTYDIKPETWWAHRDHSWGLRWHPNLGVEQGLQPVEPLQGFMFDWNIIQFENWYVNSTHREDHNGDVLDFSGAIGYAYGDPRRELKLIREVTDFEFQPENRQLKSGRIVYTAVDGSEKEISFRVLSHLYLQAGGYWPYKGFSLGMWMGHNWIDGEKLDITDTKVIKEVSTGAGHTIECRCGNEIGYGWIQFGVFGKHPRYAE